MTKSEHLAGSYALPLPELPPIVVDDDLQLDSSNFRYVRFSDWCADLFDISAQGDPSFLVLADDPPLAFLLGEKQIASFATDRALKDLIGSLNSPVWPCVEGNLSDLATRAVSDFARKQMQDATGLRSASAELRRNFSEMQTRFVHFEDFIYSSLAPKYVIAHLWKSTEVAVTLSAGMKLVQAMPVSSYALAAIDVSVVGVQGDGATLSLTITRLDGGPISDPIGVKLGPSYAGWARFHLPQALAGHPDDVALELQVLGENEVELTLSTPCPIAQYRLRVDGQPDARVLALRVFNGLPGARLPGTHPARVLPPLDGKPRLTTVFDLNPIELLQPSPSMMVEPEAADYFDCEYWANEDAILVHPSIHFPVVAAARNLIANRMTRATASIQVARHDTDTIAFAIGAAPAGVVGNSEDALPYLGQWQVLRPGEWGICEKMFDTPLEGPFDIFMATSMEGHPSNENAWALFRDFWFTNAGPET